MRGGVFTGAAHYGVAGNGTLAYVRGTSATAVRALLWVDREGRAERINAPPHNYLSAQISPDGRRIALMAFDEEFDTWIWDVERETLQRLTFGPDLSVSPIWSPDGRQVAFSAGPNEAREVYWQAADGSGGPESLTSDTPGSAMAFDFSPDGTTLIHGITETPSDIWTVAIDGSTTSSTPLIATPADERSAKVSPDGRWLAYQSDESGQYEIYVRSFPDVQAGGLWQISNAGGTSPLWSRDGRELFYFDAGTAGGGSERCNGGNGGDGRNLQARLAGNAVSGSLSFPTDLRTVL
jgi:serine/threonine-protein kinase